MSRLSACPLSCSLGEFFLCVSQNVCLRNSPVAGVRLAVSAGTSGEEGEKEMFIDLIHALGPPAIRGMPRGCSIRVADLWSQSVWLRCAFLILIGCLRSLCVYLLSILFLKSSRGNVMLWELS